MAKTVLFGGCFDLLHYGHVKAIEQAAEHGDYLIVNVMSDERAKLKKGYRRPIIPVEERVAMIKALRVVDEVFALEGEAGYPMGYIVEQLKPDVLVMDLFNHPEEEYTVKLCKELGIEFIDQPRIIAPSGLDTTKIIERVAGRYARL